MSFNFMDAVTSAVILEPKKIKSVTVSIVSPSICHEVMESDAMIFVFDGEDSLESPLDCKEIRPVHFKGKQS